MKMTESSSQPENPPTTNFSSNNHQNHRGKIRIAPNYYWNRDNCSLPFLHPKSTTTLSSCSVDPFRLSNPLDMFHNVVPLSLDEQLSQQSHSCDSAADHRIPTILNNEICEGNSSCDSSLPSSCSLNKEAISKSSSSSSSFSTNCPYFRPRIKLKKISHRTFFFYFFFLFPHLLRRLFVTCPATTHHHQNILLSMKMKISLPSRNLISYLTFFLLTLALINPAAATTAKTNNNSNDKNVSTFTGESSSSPDDLLLHSQLNHLVQELAEEESSLIQQDLEESTHIQQNHKNNPSVPPTNNNNNHVVDVVSDSITSSTSANYEDNYETGPRELNSYNNKEDFLNDNPISHHNVKNKDDENTSGKLAEINTKEEAGRKDEMNLLKTTPASTTQDLRNLRPVVPFSSSEESQQEQQLADKPGHRETHQIQKQQHDTTDMKSLLLVKPTSLDSLMMQQDEPPQSSSLSSSSFDHPHHYTDNNNGGKESGGGGSVGNKNLPSLSSSSSLHEGALQKISSSSSSHHKPLKLHKSLPQPLNPGANDPHELSRVQFHPPSSSSHHHQTQVIVMGATPTSPSVPQGTSKSSSSTLLQVSSSNNIIKPRRLESLSHGINKNRIQNSISFDDEPLAAESSAYNSIGDSSASTNLNNNNGQHILILSGRNKNSSLSSNRNSVSNNLLSSTAGIRKSPLQIRRDLSRLVAAVKDGSTGNGIDDDLSLPSKCDRLFISTPNGPRNGTFESPSLSMESGHLYQCIFMFVAKPKERVEITFHGFKVRGTPPECVHEWVDIWTEVEGTDPTDLITTPFSGRYCGKIPPRKRISLYGGIAIGFYSDRNVTDETIFHGTYSFINETRYIVGTPQPRTLCSYTILGTSNNGVGELLSPTYPGVYPKKLNCAYKFVGTVGQRIRIEFRDFDVFFGGAHCPFDDVKIYDGAEPTAPLIGTYCGQQRNLVVYSSEHMMLVTFTTLDRNTDSQNRGFNAVYEFSNGFVKLDFIEKNKGGHIRGTECDQRILSTGQSTGLIYSPNYPFLYVPKIVCRYFVYGLQDPQNLEQVRLWFEIFDVPSSTTSAEDENNQSDSKRCGDAFLKVYLKGQEVIQAYDKADHEFCGKENPEQVASDGPRLVLVFSSGDTQGGGFKANYTFRTDYRIPGTQSPTQEGCLFSYNSQSRQKGEFNSPRFPSNYPTLTNCTYTFHQKPNEQVRIVFDNFKLRADKFNYTDRGAYGTSCEEDWVEIWNVMSSQDDILVGRYCGTTAPGPIESKERATSLKVIMSTDEEGVYSGFKARYTYFTADSPFGNCGQNITQSLTGILTSPKYPGKYDGPSKLDGSAACNWYLNVRMGSRVMLYFKDFQIEGEPAGRGCPAAAVRIWEDPEGVPIELCGETLLNENRQYVSTRNVMRVTFITADKAVGAPGFQAIWTEVQDGSSGAPCHAGWFRCSKSEFCIPNDLACDGNHNCGFHQGEEDRSDELHCNKGGLEFGDMNFIFSIGVGVAVTLLVIIILCAWGQRRRRRRRRRLQLRRPPIHVCDNAGARFAAMDSV